MMQVGQPAPPVSRIQAVAPATAVRAGEPFTVVLTTRVPVGTTAAFPVGPDSGVVEAVTSADSDQQPYGPDSVTVRATYKLVAWDVGDRMIPFGDVVLERDGAALRVPVGKVAVQVGSVLPANGAAEPKPARDPFNLPTGWWSDLLIVAAALVVGALLVWWATRRWSIERPAAPSRRVDPADALRALEALALERAGEPTRVLLGAADAVREAISQAFPRTRSLTTEELVQQSLSGVPMARVASLLEDADAARYGRRPVADARAVRALAEARALVTVLRGAGMADRVGAA
jgi:hypothetical protein